MTANCKANIDTPPVPCTSTVSPLLTCPSGTSACQAVTAAQGSVAACSSLKCSGTCTTPSSLMATYSANMPGPPPPSAVRALVSSISPAIHLGMKHPATRSPTFTRDTPGPTATTSPTPSESGTAGNFSRGLYCPLAIIKSRKLSDQARIFSTTSSGPACGSG